MKEQLVVPLTPLSPEELERRKIDFPQALFSLASAKKIVKTSANGSYVFEAHIGDERRETFIVDWEVVSAMNGGIQRMHMDLVQAGEKDFADKALQESLK